jgi:hypothetical protein
MRGRYEQADRTIAEMQNTLGQLGDEVMRLQQGQQQPQDHRPAPLPTPVNPITEEDRRNYTPEFLDFVTRAARAAVAPDLDALSQQNQRVVQRVTQTQRASVYDKLDAEVPNWREVNVNPRFKTWCALRDLYSGQLRGVLLRNAFATADGPRVAAIFKGFLAEEQATGHVPAPQPVQQPPAPGHAPAVPLEALAAPGRPNPAPGTDTLGAEKPIFTRAQVAAFYADVRRGAYNGREDDKNSIEREIFAAQREGRVR